MKMRYPALLASLLFLAASAEALATTYYGLIVQAVTTTNDPAYSPGDTFFGHYQYESPTMDGTFTTPLHPTYPAIPIDSAHSLNGSIYLTFPSSWFAPFENALINTIASGLLTISNGVVTEFSWGFDYNGYFQKMGMSPSQPSTGSLNTFETHSGPFFPPGAQSPHEAYFFQTQGSLLFSAPVAAVPDSGITALLLGVSLAGLMTGRHGFSRGVSNQSR